MNEMTNVTNPAQSPIVRAWLVRLHELTTGRTDGQEATERMENVLAQLAYGRFGEGTFTRRSLEHVASKCRFWPSYGELCAALDSWLTGEQKSFASVAAPPPDENGMDEMDRAWLKFWHKRMDEIDQQQSGWKRGSRDAEIDNVDSLVRDQAPRVWRLLHPENVVIRDVPTDAQIAAVGRALRMPGAPLAGRPLPEETKKPRPAPVSDATLAAMRRARGIDVPEVEPASADEVYGEYAPA